MDYERRPLPPGQRMTGESNLAYAALHPFPLPGWQPEELIHVKGKSWQVIFKPDGADYFEIERGGKILARHLDGPNVLIGGTEGYSKPEDATEAQKPIIDAIRGLFLLAGPPASTLLLPPVWEGVLKKERPETITYESRRLEAVARGINSNQLKGWGDRWQSFDPTSSQPELSFALRWYYKGLIELYSTPWDLVDPFVSLWICVITLVRSWHAQFVGGDPSEMERFIAYAETRLKLGGDALEDAKKQFQQARDRRNELFKGGGGMKVSQEEVTAIASLAHNVLDFEIELQR